MKRRGEISMEVIIIAAIALLVLVILSVLILRSGGDFAQGTSCQGVGGMCEPDGCEFLQGHVPSGNSCPNDDDVCCMPLLGDDE